MTYCNQQKKQSGRLILLLLGMLFTSYCAPAQERPLIIEKIDESLYLYTTFSNYEGTSVSSNAVYLITDEGVILFDTPWDPTQYQPLLDSIESKHNKPVIAVYATHWHEDRAGGFDYYNKKGIPTYATALTNELLEKNNKATATRIVKTGEVFHIGGEKFKIDFPGAGHSLDNTVVWFPDHQVLHGGCFIKSAQATDLGFTGDGDIKQWKPSLARLIASYPEIKLVIPGHDSWEKADHIKATNRLLDAN